MLINLVRILFVKLGIVRHRGISFISIALGPNTAGEPLLPVTGRSAVLALRADAPPTCSGGESVCDGGCIPRGANCCRFGNNAYCDQGEYCTSDNMCCPLGKACPGPGACREGFATPVILAQTRAALESPAAPPAVPAEPRRSDQQPAFGPFAHHHQGPGGPPSGPEPSSTRAPGSPLRIIDNQGPRRTTFRVRAIQHTRTRRTSLRIVHEQGRRWPTRQRIFQQRRAHRRSPPAHHPLAPGLLADQAAPEALAQIPHPQAEVAGPTGTCEIRTVTVTAGTGGGSGVGGPGSGSDRGAAPTGGSGSGSGSGSGAPGSGSPGSGSGSGSGAPSGGSGGPGLGAPSAGAPSAGAPSGGARAPSA
ncbi:unnamed protein product [Parascedosporium putredinis]|uniref:Uncharacterized protein n=1 Tax=Parascedosporium putredinis TaxID=1442378 RepID=A0A9P1MCA6_9PEZI|nr:unnamed protein product [Parascedosporium putredinis]CAI7997492.1 unnamed protein product [Parascedosporium putredinis]